jgi:hypothetical protein
LVIGPDAPEDIYGFAGYMRRLLGRLR